MTIKTSKTLAIFNNFQNIRLFDNEYYTKKNTIQSNKNKTRRFIKPKKKKKLYI